MITLFRRIRHKLIESGAFTKYLLYAIGEILLVVIGILIALQINNWNEGFKNEQARVETLNSLNSEFEQNLKQLYNIQSRHQMVYDGILKAFSLIGTDISHVNIDSLYSLDISIQQNWTFNPRNGALKSAISSGDIHFIKSDSLKQLLFEWQDLTLDLLEDELLGRQNSIRGRELYFYPYTVRRNVSNFDHPEIERSNEKDNYQSLFDNPDFEDFLANRYVGITGILNASEIVETSNKKILELIQIELNK